MAKLHSIIFHGSLTFLMAKITPSIGSFNFLDVFKAIVIMLKISNIVLIFLLLDMCLNVFKETQEVHPVTDGRQC